MLAMVRDDYQVSYLCYMKDSIWLYNNEYYLYQHEYVTECDPSIFTHFQMGLNPGPLIWTLQLVDLQHDYIFLLQKLNSRIWLKYDSHKNALHKGSQSHCYHKWQFMSDRNYDCCHILKRTE